MKILFIAAIIVECLILAWLTIWKKWTRKTFLIVSGATAVCCCAMAILALWQNAAQVKIDQRAYLYMTSRLLQEEHYPESLETLAVVEDNGLQAADVSALRALSYNLNGAYETAASCLVGSADNDTGRLILEASQKRQPVGAETAQTITQNTLDQVNASESEVRRWEAEMKVRFMGFNLSEEEQNELQDQWALAKDAINRGETETAYNLLSKQQDVKNAVIVSNMYVRNYNHRVMADTDAEYARLWAEAAAFQADLNVASLTQNPADAAADTGDPNEDYEEYQKTLAKYQLAQDALKQESIKRAINYLLTFSDVREASSPGYHLQLARLYFMSSQLDEATRQLDLIFDRDSIPTDQWLGAELEAFRQAYILYLSTPTDQESIILFSQVMNSLYQSLFADESFQTFQEFVFSYLRDLYGGLIIRSIDRSAFPTVTAEISCTKQDLDITQDTLRLTDTGTKITDFQLESTEVGVLSLSLVLDISGSMDGQPLADAKAALRNCIAQFSDDVSMNLVTFESTAALQCNLTQSKYTVMNLVESATSTGGTNIADGLRTAVDSLKSADGARVVILLSDGYDSNESAQQIGSAISEAAANHVTVYTIGLNNCDQQYLQDIASSTGGQFIMAVNTTQLDQIYSEIQNSLRKSYRITYEAIGEEESRELHLAQTQTPDQAAKAYSLAAESTDVSDATEAYELQTADYFKQTGGTANGR